MTLATALAALALSPGQASAAQTYYVSPTGAGSACTQEAPCEIAFALGSTAPGDTVLLAGDDGSYVLTEQLNVPTGVAMKGEASQPRPVFNSTAANYGVQLGAGASLSYLELHYTSGNVLADALIATGTVERVLIDAPYNTACAPVAGNNAARLGLLGQVRATHARLGRVQLGPSPCATTRSMPPRRRCTCRPKMPRT